MFKPKNILILLFFVLIFTFFLISITYDAFFSSSTSSNSAVMLIKPGYTVTKILSEINKIHPIKNQYLVKVIIKLSSKESKLQSGEYIVEKKSSLYSIIKKLYLGETITRKITIAPGLTNYKIIQKLLQEDSLTGKIPDNILEGSLLPDTYYYKYNDTRESLIRRMQENANKNFSRLWLESKYKHSLPFQSIEQAIILASIIEKESQNHDDIKKIAGVFVNRLKRKMKLQSDPTIIYFISKKTGILNRKLTKKDINTPSVFNTYYIKGLPPTPIGNPSLKAFFYAVNPPETDYLYFVANNHGSHYFSKTLEEHNKYVQLLKLSAS